MSTRNKSVPRDDTPVIGGSQMPDALRNRKLPDLPVDMDELTADLKVLLSTNAEKLAFRAIDCEAMDDRAKKNLLIDLYRELGIKPLNEIES